jgi:UMF1 family MFS transporter
MPATSTKAPPRASLMVRLGLGRPELRAWALYDWANSVFMTIILLVYPIYFTKVAGADLAPVVATARIAFATAISMTLIAALSPVLGAMADHAGIKKKMLAVFLGFGAAATAALYFVGRGDWMLGAVLFVIGNIGVTGTIVFYESLLPHIASQDEVDRVSMAGYAVGYLGGGLPLIVALVAIQKPELFGIPDAGMAMRISFVATAVWWVVFSIPLFRTVSRRGPPARPARRGGAWSPPPSSASGGRCASCATTAMPSSSWGRSCSTTTASTPSSAWPLPTAPRSGSPRDR